MREIKLINQAKPLEKPLRVGYCNSFICRLRGLSFKRSIPADWGLLLVNKKDSRLDTAIHMLGMSFDLAVVWINEAGTVVDLGHAKRWVSFIVPREPARYVLETGVERLRDFQIGDKITFEEIS